MLDSLLHPYPVASIQVPSRFGGQFAGRQHRPTGALSFARRGNLTLASLFKGEEPTRCNPKDPLSANGYDNGLYANGRDSSISTVG